MQIIENPIRWFKPVALKCWGLPESPGVLVRPVRSAHSQTFSSAGLGGAQEFVFLTISQVMLMLAVWDHTLKTTKQ